MIKTTPEVFNRVFPIVSVDIFPSCVIVHRRSRLQGKPEQRGARKEVKDFSHSSYIRLLESVLCTSAQFRSIITLTYARDYQKDGLVCKGHLNSFLTYLRLRYGVQQYVWVMEFQKRGAVHFHILSSLAQPSKVLAVEAGLKWVAITSPSVSLRLNRRGNKLVSDYEEAIKVNTNGKFWESIRKPDGAKRYMLKYCLKPEQKQVPPDYINCGRFWGTSRNLPAGQPARVRVTEVELRTLLKNSDHRLKGWEVLPRVITGDLPGLDLY